MARQRARDTSTELALRRELHRLGLRYRVHRQPLPEVRREADVVFGPSRVAVFVDGCFWHGCPDHATLPRSNAEFWRTKIEGNRTRDADTTAVWPKQAGGYCVSGSTRILRSRHAEFRMRWRHADRDDGLPVLVG